MQSRTRSIVTMLPWLIIAVALILVWAFCQFLPPGYRLEATFSRLASVGVMLFRSLLWQRIEQEEAERKRQVEEKKEKRKAKDKKRKEAKKEAKEAESKRQEDEAERKRQEDEAEKKRQEDEAEKRRQEDEAEKRRQEDEAQRKRQEDGAEKEEENEAEKEENEAEKKPKRKRKKRQRRRAKKEREEAERKRQEVQEAEKKRLEMVKLKGKGVVQENSEGASSSSSMGASQVNVITSDNACRSHTDLVRSPMQSSSGPSTTVSPPPRSSIPPNYKWSPSQPDWYSFCPENVSEQESELELSPDQQPFYTLPPLFSSDESDNEPSITREIMVDPVSTADGHSSADSVDPTKLQEDTLHLPSAPLDKTLWPNHSLRSQIFALDNALKGPNCFPGSAACVIL